MDCGDVSSPNLARGALRPVAAFVRTPVILSRRTGKPDASPNRECGALLGNPWQLERLSLALGQGEIRALKQTQRLVSF